MAVISETIRLSSSAFLHLLRPKSANLNELSRLIQWLRGIKRP